MNTVSSVANEFDVVVLGSGAAGMTTALVAAVEGLSVCLLEKEVQLGGTTAWSGGQVWAPCNQVGKEEGFEKDSPEFVSQYLNKLVVDSKEDPRMASFLKTIPVAVEFLGRHSQVQLQRVPYYPDYYPDLGGATVSGRVLEPVSFDASVLGSNLGRLRLPLPEFSLFGDMMVARQNLTHFRRVFHSPSSMKIVLKALSRHAWEKFRFGRGVSLVLGNALVARFFASLLDLNVTIKTERLVESLVRSGERRVVGVQLANGRIIRARRGVVLATGGFSHNFEMRVEKLPSTMSESSATFPGATGDGARLATAIGGHFSAAAGGNAFLAPISRYKRPDGSIAIFAHTVSDRAKPGVIAVDQNGNRFANEAVSYHEFGRALLSHHNQGAGGKVAFAWLIADKKFIWKYGLGALKPMHLNLHYLLSQKYIVKAPSLEKLAEKLNIPAMSLVQTVTEYNASAKNGEDPKYRRGSNAYQRFLGDPDVKPNPCISAIESPSYFALRIEVGDLGTAAGITTDSLARVLDERGNPIEGLYACGADARSVMEGNYPGPGITLGPAIAFGYLAVQNIKYGAGVD